MTALLYVSYPVEHVPLCLNSHGHVVPSSLFRQQFLQPLLNDFLGVNCDICCNGPNVETRPLLFPWRVSKNVETNNLLVWLVARMT